MVVIIGVMAGLASLSLGGNDTRLLKKEAQRLQQLLNMAQDEATFQQQNIGVRFDREGYSFLQYTIANQQWETYEQTPYQKHQFELPIDLMLELEGTALELKNAESDSDEKPAQLPELLLLASGEGSAFSLTLTLRDDDRVLQQLSSDGFSPIERLTLSSDR